MSFEAHQGVARTSDSGCVAAASGSRESEGCCGSGSSASAAVQAAVVQSAAVQSTVVPSAVVLPGGVPLLYLDASAPCVQVGLWQDGRWLAHRWVEEPALEAVFRQVNAVLAETAVRLEAVAGFIHNEGPGSVLGIRLAAMALRVWSNAGVLPEKVARPVWVVRSLPLVAAKLRLLAGQVEALCSDRDSAAQSGFCVISEFRQGLWNYWDGGSPANSAVHAAATAGATDSGSSAIAVPAATADGDVLCGRIDVVETDELVLRTRGKAVCYYLRHRKNWEEPPFAVCEADSNLAACPQVLALPGLLRLVEQPGAFLTQPPQFKTADGERHRAATAGGPVATAADAPGRAAAVVSAADGTLLASPATATDAQTPAQTPSQATGPGAENGGSAEGINRLSL